MKPASNGTASNLVLLIEDDPSQLRTLADIIENEGFQPVCCQTEGEAFDALKELKMNPR